MYRSTQERGRSGRAEDVGQPFPEQSEQIRGGGLAPEASGACARLGALYARLCRTQRRPLPKSGNWSGLSGTIAARNARIVQ